MTETELHIEKPVYGGYGLAFLEGKAVFVENAIAGERVLAGIHQEKKDHCFARIERILEPSPHRQEPPCPAFGRCGGCSYLCLSHGKELEYKKDIITDSLLRMSGINLDAMPGIATISSDRFNYRSHAGLKVRDGRIGFYRRESNDLEPLPEQGCLLLDERLNARLKEIRAGRDFSIAVDSDGLIATSLEGETLLAERELGITYRRGLSGFYQANRLLRPRMLETAGEYAAPAGGEEFLDIACGVGFFSLYMAPFCRGGHGVDINRQSIEMARRNAAENGISNVTFSAMAASAINPGRHRCDVIIADPPRAGLDKKTRHTINAIEPEKLVYVSCNPSTFARDARDFLKGGYRLERLTLIDMFPGTHHIELISKFVK
jgi:tRNA/tmRNA/rRNA uracil-C5-methylase (TrmA/RlmC/RlmD family)